MPEVSRRFAPIVVVAYTEPSARVARREFVRPVIAKVEEVAFVKVVFWKLFVPEKVLLFASKVEDAAVIVMFAVPSKETPLIVRGVWSAVAVPAFPEMEPVMVEEKVFTPLKVFASLRSVELAAVRDEVAKVYTFPLAPTASAPFV